MKALCWHGKNDYSDRSGFSESPDQMRGRARTDFQMPRDMSVVLKPKEELALS